MRFVVVFLAVWLSVPASAQTGNVSGYTVDGYVADQHGRPLGNLTVRLDRVGAGQYFETKTDSKGNYIHASLPGGKYLVSITKDGHVYTLGTRLGVQDTITTVDGIIQSFVQTARVNFDLRQLAPYDPQEARRVTVAGLKI